MKDFFDQGRFDKDRVAGILVGAAMLAILAVWPRTDFAAHAHGPASVPAIEAWDVQAVTTGEEMGYQNVMLSLLGGDPCAFGKGCF